MNRKYTLIVILGVVALVALAVWQRDAAPVDLGKGTPTPTPGPVLSLAAADVQELAVAGTAGQLVTVARAAGGWEVDGAQAADAVSSTVGSLLKLAATQSLPLDRKAEEYGFDTPKLTVTLKTAAGATTVLQVGDDVPGQSGYAFVRLGGEGQPILVVSNADLTTLADWLTNKPLAPTPTAAAGAAGTPAEGSPFMTMEAGTPGAGGTAVDSGAMPVGTAPPVAGAETPAASATP